MLYSFPAYPIPIFNPLLAQPVHPQAPFYPTSRQTGTPYMQIPASSPLHNGQLHTEPYPPQPRQQYPEVDPTLFRQSAESFKQLMNDGRTLLNKLGESESFAKQVMDAAQRNDKEKVKQLMEATGIQAPVKTRFNPDEILINLYSDDQQTACCQLSMGLQWQ